MNKFIIRNTYNHYYDIIKINVKFNIYLKLNTQKNCILAGLQLFMIDQFCASYGA